ncbi:MAG: FG-GAP-like repeat-containing protein [Isosphaerales bacterium]
MKTCRRFRRVGLAVLVIAAIAVPGVWLLTEPDLGRSFSAWRAAGTSAGRTEPSPASRSEPDTPLYSESFIDDSGYSAAFRYSAPIEDRSSLAQCYASAAGRVDRGIADLQSQLDQLAQGPLSPLGNEDSKVKLQAFISTLYMYDGRFALASSWIEKALAENRFAAREVRANLRAIQGVAALRRGEIDNCVACLGPSSCIFPISREAVHQRTEGSREAIRFFTLYLNERPGDLGVRWLLNIAYMTLGEYPEKVPAAFLISPAVYASKYDPGRFLNIAPRVGLDSRGPNMLGGSVFDDFTGDGRPDILVLSGDWDLGGSLFVNRGGGRFEDRGRSAGLAGQRMSVNLSAADFDNDGDLDVLALRGGWETPFRLSLLRNNGNGVFDDATVSAGLGEPIASQSAAWGDYDNDGLLDVYVAGEYDVSQVTPQNLCRLYHNRGDGTFENVAEKAGVLNARFAKGVAWGDYDNDGDLDLYVSNMKGPNRLYRNEGDGTFTDVAPDLGVTEPINSFSCWFWDYDNDGRLDLFVAGFSATLADIVADMLGRPAKGERPRLYRNLGPAGFKDVTAQSGLNRVTLTMGSNFADIDNDGFLDVFLATGQPAISALIPDLMFRNVDGRRFEDVTTSSGTGHLQKGHGVSFADWDDDGDVDLFVQAGGQTPGDKAHNLLFQNPGNDHHWIKLKLVGTQTNRAAVGARIRVDIEAKGGPARSIYRTVGNNSSFGGNSLVQSIGLQGAARVTRLTVSWPVSRTSQTFSDLAADQSIEITEGKPEWTPWSSP